MILSIFKVQSKAQMQSEFANNFTNYKKMPLNKNAIGGNRKEKGIQNKSQEISNIKSNK